MLMLLFIMFYNFGLLFKFEKHMENLQKSYVPLWITSLLLCSIGLIGLINWLSSYLHKYHNHHNLLISYHTRFQSNAHCKKLSASSFNFGRILVSLSQFNTRLCCIQSMHKRRRLIQSRGELTDWDEICSTQSQWITIKTQRIKKEHLENFKLQLFIDLMAVGNSIIPFRANCYLQEIQILIPSITHSYLN